MESTGMGSSGLVIERKHPASVLYHFEKDPTQSNDLAAKMPDKLKEMQNSGFRAGGCREGTRATI
jgi:hypothetical protein